MKDLSSTGATLSGSFTGATANPSEVGFEWGTTTALGNKISLSAQSATSGSFSKSLSGLDANTTYYYRAYVVVAGSGSYAAQNSTIYGSVVAFKTNNTVQKGAYLGCLEVPAVSLASTTASVKSGAAYYGRQHEFTTTNSSQVVVVHQFDDYGTTSGASTGTWHRNYSILYDNSMYAARWVAYSLSDWHFPLSSSISRPDWEDNPSLNEYSGGYQQNTTYDRGHQIANMMRNRCSANSQQQTFFHSNQMPQINSFNQGKWVALEQKELSWKSECDTMYVVTGPIFDSGYSTTLDRSGNRIPVATRYFKAMIKCNWSNGTLTEVKGIGFLMDNVDNASVKPYTSAYTSIEEVEKACGYTLFTNLPAAFISAKQNSSPSAFTSNW